MHTHIFSIFFIFYIFSIFFLFFIIFGAGPSSAHKGWARPSRPRPGPATVIKPGPAWWVNPRPGRPGGWTGPGLIKDRLWQQPGQTRATRANPNETRFYFLFLFIFFQMWDLKSISIYTICSKEKNRVFSMWDKKLFGLNIST